MDNPLRTSDGDLRSEYDGAADPSEYSTSKITTFAAEHPTPRTPTRPTSKPRAIARSGAFASQQTIAGSFGAIMQRPSPQTVGAPDDDEEEFIYGPSSSSTNYYRALDDEKQAPRPDKRKKEKKRHEDQRVLLRAQQARERQQFLLWNAKEDYKRSLRATIVCHVFFVVLVLAVFVYFFTMGDLRVHFLDAHIVYYDEDVLRVSVTSEVSNANFFPSSLRFAHFDVYLANQDESATVFVGAKDEDIGQKLSGGDSRALDKVVEFRIKDSSSFNDIANILKQANYFLKLHGYVHYTLWWSIKEELSYTWERKHTNP